MKKKAITTITSMFILLSVFTPVSYGADYAVSSYALASPYSSYRFNTYYLDSIWQTKPDFRVKAYQVCAYPYGGYLYDYNLQVWVENVGGNKGISTSTNIPVQFYIPHYYPDPLWDETDGYRIKYAKAPMSGETTVVTWSGETYGGPLPNYSSVWVDRNDHHESFYKYGQFYPYAGTVAEVSEYNNKESLSLYNSNKYNYYCWASDK